MTMKRMQAIMVTITLLLFATVLPIAAADYAHELTDKDISFAWSVDGDTLAVKLSAKTDGWVGIGFNPTKSMQDANFILGYVKKGEAKIIDEFGDKENGHTSDEKLGGTTDVTLVSGTEDGGVTTIEFTMPLKSEDKNDTALDVAGETTVLLAYGAGRDSFKSKHKYRSTYMVNLTTGVSTKAK
jgi:hypothetical protein